VEFLEQLRTDYPEAYLDLRKPAESDEDARTRIWELARAYAVIAGCKDALITQEEYSKYIGEFSSILEIDPKKTEQAFNQLLAKGIAAASVFDLLFMEGSAHAANALTAAEVISHGLDAKLTFGASLLVSGLAWWYYGKKNGALRRKVEFATEMVYLNAKLAKTLMTAQQDDGSVSRVLQLIVERPGGPK
jgi:hypothetical protein